MVVVILAVDSHWILTTKLQTAKQIKIHTVTYMQDPLVIELHGVHSLNYSALAGFKETITILINFFSYYYRRDLSNACGDQ
jgi:hypothetical protein